jgi:hypothetical protein
MNESDPSSSSEFPGGSRASLAQMGSGYPDCFAVHSKAGALPSWLDPRRWGWAPAPPACGGEDDAGWLGNGWASCHDGGSGSSGGAAAATVRPLAGRSGWLLPHPPTRKLLDPGACGRRKRSSKSPRKEPWPRAPPDTVAPPRVHSVIPARPAALLPSKASALMVQHCSPIQATAGPPWLRLPANQPAEPARRCGAWLPLAFTAGLKLARSGRTLEVWRKDERDRCALRGHGRRGRPPAAAAL